MINFREIFNVKYGYIGIGIIVLFLLILIFVNKDIFKSFRNVGVILIISGIISAVIGLLFNFGINIFVDSTYKVFVDVIGDSFYSSLLVRGGICLVFGIVLEIIGVVLNRKKI